jgi:Rhs element Vgr protein
MSNDRTIPSDAPRSVSTFTILSNGAEVSKTYHVLSIVIGSEINRIPSATILIMDGEPSRQTFDVSNTRDFQPGAAIEIHAGQRGKEEPVFKGIVIRHSIKVRKATSVLSVEVKDKAVTMTTLPKSKFFHDSTDSDIIEQLLTAAGLDKDVASTAIKHRQLVQFNTTDWDFMLCRADVNGLICIVRDGKVSVSKPDFTQAPALTVQYGATVKELDAEIDARLIYASVTATAWDPAEQALVSGVEASDPSVPQAGDLSVSNDLAPVANSQPLQLVHSGHVQEAELKAWADAKLMTSRLAKIRGRVRVDGTNVAKAGQLISLKGAGHRFEGNLYLSGVRHEIQSGIWDTIFQFGVEPKWFAARYHVQQPLAGAMLPAVRGLQIGVVTRLEGDPDGEERIMARIPIVHAQDEGVWARIASVDAGSNRGVVFRPEIGDEVILGFVNNDPRDAVILGMLHSSKNAPPIPATDANDTKGYTSRSGIALVFDDKAKAFTFSTPGGNKISISDQDKKIQIEDTNGNKLVMSQDGIQIESTKALGMKASTDFKAEALNASLKGSTQLTAQGGSSAEFSSGGNTALKGAMVQIN